MVVLDRRPPRIPAGISLPPPGAGVFDLPYGRRAVHRRPRHSAPVVIPQDNDPTVSRRFVL